MQAPKTAAKTDLSKKKSIALVLSGGGVKAAAFHVGVCLALRQKGFHLAGGTAEEVDTYFHNKSPCIKTYVGSSAGAFVAAALAAGHSVASIIHAYSQGQGISPWPTTNGPNVRTTPMPPLGYSDIFSMQMPSTGLSNVGKSIGALFQKSASGDTSPGIALGLEGFVKKALRIGGVFSTKNLEKYIRTHVCKPHNSFEKLGAQLFVVTTELDEPKRVVFCPSAAIQSQHPQGTEVEYANYASISQAVAASTSLPPMFVPYSIANKQGKEVYFFDGEIRDTLSTHVAADAGADLIISSYSMQPYSRHESIGSLNEHGMPSVINQAICQGIQHKINSARSWRRHTKAFIKELEDYAAKGGLKPQQMQHIKKLLHHHLGKPEGVEYVYIHPHAQDYDMFFADHFSLNPKIIMGIVSVGFKAALNALSPYTI